MTGLLTTTGQQFQDWSADYRLYGQDRVDPMRLLDTVRRAADALLPAGQPLVLALDDSILRKRGHKIPATAWRPDPLGAPFQVNFVWAQRVLQMAVALPEGTDGAARTVPVDFVLAPTAVRPRRGASEAEHEAYRQDKQRLNLNQQALERLTRLVGPPQQEAPPRPRWVVVDGRFTNRTFLQGVPDGVVVIGRIRGDARLHEAVPPTRTSPLGGRPRAYGPALPTPEHLLRDNTFPSQTVEAFAAGKRHRFQIKTLQAVRWRVSGALRSVRLIVIAPLAYRPCRGHRLLYRRAAYLICTDPSLPVEQVVQAYLWRWGIEVNWRDEKTLLGVGQARVRNPRSVQNVPATAVAAYALLLMAAYRSGLTPALPPPRWRRARPPARGTTAALINHLRAELWGNALHTGLGDFSSALPRILKSQKPHPHLASAVLYAIAG